MTLDTDWHCRRLRRCSHPSSASGLLLIFFSPLSLISSQLLSNAALSVVFGEESVFAVSARLLNTLSGRRFLTLFTLSLPIKPNTRPLFTAARMALCSSLWRDWIRWFILDQPWMKETRKSSLHPLAGCFFVSFCFVFFSHWGFTREQISCRKKRKKPWQLNKTALPSSNSWFSFSQDLLRPLDQYLMEVSVMLSRF